LCVVPGKARVFPPPSPTTNYASLPLILLAPSGRLVSYFCVLFLFMPSCFISHFSNFAFLLVALPRCTASMSLVDSHDVSISRFFFSRFVSNKLAFRTTDSFLLPTDTNFFFYPTLVIDHRHVLPPGFPESLLIKPSPPSN